MDINKIKIDSMDDLCGYESPITMAVRKHCDKILEERENAIVARISEEMALDINKEELLKALQYDRDQYNKGYRDGYRAAEIKMEKFLKPCYNCKHRPDKVCNDFACADCYGYDNWEENNKDE